MGPGRRERVFVYGTLRRGGSNGWRMAGSNWIGLAEVAGRLYRIDWYPGLVLDSAAGPVTGELFEVDEALLATLDDYEGPEYRRVLTRAALCGDSCAGSCEAWVWEWHGGIDEASRLARGDWLADHG
jgi:gamma-glutamylcyclotransferase (GGCT)/AIG2-like uncharacterized protein YtfP